MTSVSLQIALEQRCERIRKRKGSVLFRRGEKATGVFIVLRGKVSLDLGVDTTYSHSYGTGALLGLPAALTKSDYKMMATIVTENAEVGFCSTQALDSLLQERPELCPQLLAILSERMAENQRVAKAILGKEKHPLKYSGMI